MADTASTGDALKTSGSRRRNKKSNAVNTVEISKLAATETPVPVVEAAVGLDIEDKLYDTPHIREIQKNMRNVNKKLAGTAKVDAILAENPNVTVDDLVAQRKINADQRAQVLKKPALEAQFLQLEEQLAMLKKIEDGFQDRLRVERERLESAHKHELESLRGELSEQTATQADDSFREKLLTLSKFLRAAAARRAAEEEAPEDTKASEEGKAFEGLLLLVYGGDSGAADAVERLIEGSSDAIPSTDGDLLSVTYERVKELSLEYVPPYAIEEAWVNGVAEAQGQPPPATDPTIANAGLNEARGEEMSAQPAVTEVELAADTPVAPAQTDIGGVAANNAANDQWDATTPGAPEDVEGSWVSVPRPAEETEQKGVMAPPNSGENWADEQPVESVAPAAVSQTGSDGFREVHHGRGRGRGGYSQDQRGRGRGGGYRGDGRGRGHRGDRAGFRGRGRGGGGQRGRGDASAA